MACDDASTERFCDVLVVGGGGAGMAAAIEAADAGASVVVLEAGPKPGGSTALSAGVFYAAGTSTQRDADIEDSPERLFHHYMTLNQWNLEPWLVRRFCELAAPTLEWLKTLGVPYPASELYQSGVDDVARGHQTPGGGADLFARLYGAAGARGVETHCAIRVESLIVEEGAVVGVQAHGAAMRAGGVVLATGGIGDDRELLAEYYPAAAVHEPRWSFYFGCTTVRGDGHRMARAIGAAIVGRDRGLLSATPGLSHEPSPYFPTWMIMVNVEGRRFMDETAPYAVSGDLIRLQIGSRCFGIFDEAARASAGSRNALFEKMGGLGDYAFRSDRILQEVERHRILTGATLPELAERLGIRPGALVATVEAYNEDAHTGQDQRFEKPGPLAPVAVPPFYGVEIRAASYGMTAAGIRIDPEARAYSLDERVIPGLFAAGEASGGVFGDRYVAGGNAISNSIIFGRIAGRNAAARARRSPHNG